MKKLILLLVAAGAGFTAMAQVRGGDNFYAQKYVIDLNFPVGVALQSPTNNQALFSSNYTNVANYNVDKLKMGAGASYGIDAQFGYFVGKRRRFGIGAGVSYFSQQCDVTLGAFKVEYQDMATGISGPYTYRQVVTATHAIKEELKTTSMNIPVVLKYKQRFTTKLGFTMDAGILYNVQNTVAWKSDAEFNYEAILQFDAATSTPIYDKGVVPDVHDWLITQDMYDRTHTANTTKYYFDSLHSRGYNVALGVKPTNNNGTFSYTTGSIGFIVRPAINVKLTNRAHLNLGAYFSYQSFNNNTVDNNYKLIDEMGAKYGSMMKTVSSVTNTNMGLNIGLRYFIGEPKDKDFDGMYDE